MAPTLPHFIAATVHPSAGQRRFLLIMAVLVSCMSYPVHGAWSQPQAPSLQADAALQDRLPAGQIHAGFQVVARYVDQAEQPAGLRLTHVATGTPVHILQMDTVPQAAMAIHTYPDSDRGAAHALEHLLIGKGRTGRTLQAMAEMRLGQITASTGERYTWYHFSVESGMASFYEVLGHLLEALFRPDFSDLEARQEVYHLGLDPQAQTDQQRLIEQGTVYTEMQGTEGMYAYWHALLKRLLGAEHPMTFSAGGTPEGIRQLTAREIRRFHRQHYVLGATTPLVLVVDRQQDLAQVLMALSDKLTAVGAGETEGRRSGVSTQRPRVEPIRDKTWQVVPTPGLSASDPASIALGWPPSHLPAWSDRLLLESFLAVFGQGSTSVLYRSLVDSQTRQLDVGATGVESLLLPTYEQARPLGLLWIEGIPGHRLTPAQLEAIRAHVQAKLRALASYADHSPELLAINDDVLASLTDRQRSLLVWHRHPPGFGQRGLDPVWIEHLQRLDEATGPSRSLVLQDVWPQLRSALTSGRNFWGPLLDRAGLLDAPYGSVAMPTPVLRDRLQEAQRTRLAAAVAELRRQYGSADDQEVLRRLAADRAREDQHAATTLQGIELPGFTTTPPHSFDDALPYTTSTIAGVPALITTVPGLSLAEIGLAFDLGAVPPRLYRYLPVLPGIIRSIGLREEGAASSHQASAAYMQQHLYRLQVNYDVNPAAGRYELVLKASGAGPEEFQAALAYAHRLMHDNDLSEQNLPRLNALLQHQLQSERLLTQRPEEEWLETLAQAFRYQHDPLLLSLSAQPTRLHHLQRLSWLLAGPLAPETHADLRLFAAQVLRSLRGLSVADIERRLAAGGETGWRGRLVDYWRAHLRSWPPHMAWEGLRRLTSEALSDLQIGHSQAIIEMRELQTLVLNRARLRLWLVGDQGVLEGAQPHVAALVQSFPRQTVANRPGDEVPFIWNRLRQRQPRLTVDYPVYVGYAQEGAVTGSVMVTAHGPRYTDDDESSLIELLAAKVLAGTGPHTWYKKTWEAGLAYGNGLDIRPRTGTLLYYADRNPSVRATLAFARSLARDVAWLSEPSYVEYALAQTFNFSRAAQPWTARAEAMAVDVAEGLTPERMQRFSRRILALRRDPRLLERLREALPRVVAKVTLGQATGEQQSAAQTLFFVVAPEPQLAELETELHGRPLARLWPSDFWLD